MAEEPLCNSFAKRKANMSHQAFVNKQAHVTHFVEEVLDVVFHVFILFTALCALLQFIIGPTYTQVMQDQVRTTMQSIELPPLSPSQELALYHARPVLEALQRMNAKPSEHVVTNNHWLFVYAHTISIMLLLLFLVLIWVLRKMLGAKAGTPTTNVLKNNLLLIFPAILIAEFAFFEMIAMKFVPLYPSDFIKMFGNILHLRTAKEREAAAAVQA